jgi:hypothetical protein
VAAAKAAGPAMEGGDAEDVEEIEDTRQKLQTFALEEYRNVARVSKAMADSFKQMYTAAIHASALSVVLT